MLEGARTLLEEQVFAYMYVFLQKKTLDRKNGG